MRDYISRLLDHGQVHVVEREVDPRFELAAVVGRSQQQSDLPILFRKVKGTRIPVVSNVYGSHRRLCELIGAGVGDFCRTWQSITDGRLPGPAPGVPIDHQDLIHVRAMQAEIETFKQLGAHAVLTKPFNALTLPDDLKKALE